MCILGRSTQQLNYEVTVRMLHALISYLLNCNFLSNCVDRPSVHVDINRMPNTEIKNTINARVFRASNKIVASDYNA